MARKTLTTKEQIKLLEAYDYLDEKFLRKQDDERVAPSVLAYQKGVRDGAKKMLIALGVKVK